MKTSYLAILITGSFCLSTSPMLFGEAPPPPSEKNAKEEKKSDARRERFPEELFKKMDADNDGKVSKEEFMKSAEERFSKFDGNNDGFLEKEDVPEKVRERIAQKKPQLKGGANTGGKISKEAFLQMNAKRFEKMDSNNDGFIDKTEFESDVRKMRGNLGRIPQTGPRKRQK